MGKALIELLQTSALCHGLTEAQIARLVCGNAVRLASYARNDILFWTDKKPDRLYILIHGNIAMAKDTAGGKRSLSKGNTTPGDLIGDVRLFSSKKLLWEYAVALENSEALEIDSGLFVCPGTIDADIQTVLLRNIIENVVDKIDNLGQKVRLLSIASARERIAFYLLGIQDKDRRMRLNTTREALADYLGMARPSLSRELGRMQDEGIIRLGGREVIIVDQRAFDALIE